MLHSVKSESLAVIMDDDGVHLVDALHESLPVALREGLNLIFRTSCLQVLAVP